MKTIDTINGVKQLNPSDINHCSPVKNSMSTYHRKREGFEGKVSCRIKCRNGIERSVSMNHTFTNEAMELDTGDGNLHASFNITLDLWANSICLHLAKKECGDLDQIESSALKDIHSGLWSYKGPIICPSEKEAEKIANDPEMVKKIFPEFKLQYVPFGKESKAILSTKASKFNIDSIQLPPPGHDVENEKMKVNPEGLIERFIMTGDFMEQHEDLFDTPDLTREKIQEYVLKVTGKKNIDEFVEWRIKEEKIEAKECKKTIEVHACYGDCINNGIYKAVMATNAISTANIGQKIVCADNLYAFIKKNNVPKSLRPIYCTQFLNLSFRQKSSFSGTSCSAFRFKDPCPSLF